MAYLEVAQLAPLYRSHPEERIGLRMQAAKALLPFWHRCVH